MRIAIYSRKSVATGKGESIENQIEMCRQYSYTYIPCPKEHDITIYEDEGYSAKNMDRPQFQQLLNDMRIQPFDYLVCYRLDRISRSVSDFSSLIEELNRLNISFICIKEKFDTSTPMGKAMMYIASVFAQLERETIAERVKDNMFMLARTGRWLGGTAPTGYSACHKESILVDGHLKNTCQLTTNMEEIYLVDFIYQAYLKHHSLTAVVNCAKEQKLQTRNGNHFSITSMKEILQNPAYCIADTDAYTYFLEQQSDVCFSLADCSPTYGLLAYNKRDYKHSAKRLPKSQWIIAIGKHPGIIAGADWIRVQQLLDRNRKKQTEKTTRNEYALLSGILTCAKCGETMFAKLRSNSPTVFDYICRNKQNRTKSCSCKNVNGSITDQKIMEILLSKLRLQKHCDSFQAFFQEAYKKENYQKQQCQTRLKEVQFQIEQLLLSITKGTWHADSLTVINKKLAQLESERSHLLNKEVPFHQAYLTNRDLTLQQYIKQIGRLSDKLSIQQKRELIHIMVASITWDNTTLHLTLKSSNKNYDQ